MKSWLLKGRFAGVECIAGKQCSRHWKLLIAQISVSRPICLTHCCTCLGYNRPEDRILPADFDWSDRKTLEQGLKTLTDALRPWTIDFHVAQNDGTVHGTGSHDKTGRHCLATDPNGKLDVVHDAGYWLRDDQGKLTKAFKHICWDGCMFPNEVMTAAKNME